MTDTIRLKHGMTILLKYGILTVGALTMLFPFIWMILTAMKGYGEAVQIPPTLFPKEFRLDNFQNAWMALPFLKLYYNTIALITLRIVCAVFLSATAAYAFARINFPFKNMLFGIVLIQMMLPAQLFIIPQYLMVAKLGWLNSLQALVFPGLVSAFGTFLLRQHYRGIPLELEEAARLDGCNHWQIFWRIMFPLSRNHIIALGIFTALFAYKDLMWPLIVNMSMDQMTLAPGITSLNGQYESNFPMHMAASFIAMWPIVVLYVMFQKQLIEGITFTGSK